MAERMGMFLDWVSADPDGRGRDGYCDYDIRRPDNETDLQCHWRRSVIAYAGSVAEAMFYGGEPESILIDQRDYRELIVDGLDKLGLGSAEQLRFWPEILAESKARTNRAAINSVAGELLSNRRLSGDDVRRILSNSECPKA